MTELIAIPNVSEGRDEKRIRSLVAAVDERGARTVDVHADRAHNRAVFTVVGAREALIEAMTRLAIACRAIDLTTHRGAHPRLGALDVCPFVAHLGTPREAVDAAHIAGAAIGDRAGLPVYFYAAAALRPETRELPDLRRGGLATLIRRAAGDLPPDVGPTEIDPRRGVVCVGARSVLIAFNVWLACDVETARRIAARVRTHAGGPPGVRALGLRIGTGVSQVSMNLVEPDRTGIDAAFELVATVARAAAVEVRATEIVGLVPERYLPDPEAQAARLLIEPGRSLESALKIRP